MGVLLELNADHIGQSPWWLRRNEARQQTDAATNVDSGSFRFGDYGFNASLYSLQPCEGSDSNICVKQLEEVLSFD